MQPKTKSERRVTERNESPSGSDQRCGSGEYVAPVMGSAEVQFSAGATNNISELAYFTEPEWSRGGGRRRAK